MVTEYVAAGTSLAYGAYSRAIQALAWAIDDITADFGDDIYERMLLDSQVAACITIFKAAIIEEGMKITPIIDLPDHPDYAKANDIAKAAHIMMESMEQSFDDVLWEMLDCICFGSRVAELVYEVQDMRDAGLRLNVTKIKPKPRRSTAFVVDQFMNLIGVVGARPGELYPRTIGPIVDIGADPNSLTNVIPRRKFMITSFRPKNGDPRGTSLLRAAYDSWYRKRQIMPEYLRFLSIYAVPALIGTTPPDAQEMPETDPLGNLTEALEGETPVGDEVLARATPEQLLLTALQAVRNGMAAAFPDGTKINVVQVKGTGEAFLNAIAECNLGITKAVLTQQLATEEGQHQARAAAEVHQDVMGTLIRQGRRALIRSFRRDVLTPWVAYNWGPEASHLVPMPTLGVADRTDLSQLMSAVAALFRSGYLHNSQLPDTDRILNLPVRDLEPGEEQNNPNSITATNKPAPATDNSVPSDSPPPTPNPPTPPPGASNPKNPPTGKEG